MTSILSAFPFIGEQSFATPGAFNSPLSTISANIAAINADVGAISGITISPPSGNTIQMPSDLSISGYLSVGKGVSIGTQAPGIPEPVALTIGVNSGISDYIYFNDTANLRSDYLLGSHVGGTADGLNIFDVSGNTMIVSFSKQSIRFYQQVVGPVFDVGGALASTLNAATFGTGADSKESRIQSAIDAASLAAISRVYVPASMYPYSASSISFVYPVQMVREGGPWNVYDPVAYGAAANGVKNDAVALQQCIRAAESSGTLSDGIGSTVFISGGTLMLGSGITILGQIQVTGTGRTTLLKAIVGTFPVGANMVQLGNGAYIIDSCRLQNLVLDCSGILGTTCVYSTDVQEQSGLVNCGLKGFTRYGANFDGSVGAGVSDMYIRDCEFFPSSSATTATSLRLNSTSWKNVVENITIDPGASTNTQPTGVYINNARLAGFGFHIEDCLQAVHFDTGAHGSIHHLDSLNCLRTVRNDAGVGARVVLHFVSRTGGSSTISDNANNIDLTNSIIPGYVAGDTTHFVATSLGIQSYSSVSIAQALTVNTGAGSPPSLHLEGPGLVFFETNTRSGALADENEWRINRNGTIIWRVGASIWSSVGEFGIYNNALGKYVLSFDTLTGSAAFPSTATVNLLQSRLVSMRTIAASALTASAANTNVAVNEAVFTIQASGASFVINSGGTTWIFNSSASAKNT